MKIGTRVRIKDSIAGWHGIIAEQYRCTITNKEIVNVKLANGGRLRGAVLNFWLNSVESIEPVKLKKFKAWK